MKNFFLQHKIDYVAGLIFVALIVPAPRFSFGLGVIMFVLGFLGVKLFRFRENLINEKRI